MAGFYQDDQDDELKLAELEEMISFYFFAKLEQRNLLNEDERYTRNTLTAAASLYLSKPIPPGVPYKDDATKLTYVKSKYPDIVNDFRLTESEILLWKSPESRTPICPFCSCTSGQLNHSLRDPMNQFWHLRKQYVKYRWGIDPNCVCHFFFI